MKNQFEDEGFVIFQRNFRNSSKILYILTCNNGLISAVYRIKKNYSHKPNYTQRYYIQFNGKSNLKTIYKLEALQQKYSIKKKSLLSLLYIQELMYKLITFDVDMNNVAISYQNLLLGLERCNLNREENQQDIECCLRKFEISLIDELGYSIDFVYDENGELIKTNTYYFFNANNTFSQVSLEDSNSIKGEHLISISNGELNDRMILRIAKYLMKMILNQILNQSLSSRKLFISS